MQILKLFRHEKEITSLTSSVRIFDRWRSKVCPPLTWSCSVDTKAFRKNKQNKRLQKQICKYQNGSSNPKNNGYKSIALPSISRARSPVSRILQAAEDTKYQTNYQWTAAGKPRAKRLSKHRLLCELTSCSILDSRSLLASFSSASMQPLCIDSSSCRMRLVRRANEASFSFSERLPSSRRCCRDLTVAAATA